jgi:threonine dehydratase
VISDAGAAAWAAAVREKSRLRGKKVAVVVSGGNVDRALFAAVLDERF